MNCLSDTLNKLSFIADTTGDWDGVCPVCRCNVPENERDSRAPATSVQTCIRCRRLFRARFSKALIVDSLAYDFTLYAWEQQVKINEFIVDVSDGKWGVIAGKSGIGKTLTATIATYSAIVKRLVQLEGGSAVRFIDIPSWSADYSEAGYKKGEVYEQATNGKRLLVLDDVGREKDSQLVNRLIHEGDLDRVQIIITTNLIGREFVDRYKDNIWSRVIGGAGKGCAILKLDGTDKRKARG